MFIIRKKKPEPETEKPMDGSSQQLQDLATVKLALIQALELGKSEPFSLSRPHILYLDKIVSILLRNDFDLPICTTSKTMLESVDIDGNPIRPRIDVFRFDLTEDRHFVIHSYYKEYIEEYKKRFDEALAHIQELYTGTPKHVLDELKAEISKLQASLPKSKTLDAYIKKDRQICVLDLIHQTLMYNCECSALLGYTSWSDTEKVINCAKEKYGHLVNLEVKKPDENTCWLVCTTK